MNPAVPDPSSFGRGLDSPSSFFKNVYDHDPFGMDPQPPAGVNGGGYNGSSASVTNGAQCFGKAIGQENVDAAFAYGSPASVMPPSPFSQPNAVSYQHSTFPGGPAAGAGYGGSTGGGIPPSPSSGSGPMFSPNPMPDSTTNFQHQAGVQTAFAKQQNGFCAAGNGDRRASVDAVLFDHDIKPALASSYFEPLRSNSVDYSSYSRFVDAKQEPTFGASEAGASNGNGVSQSQKAFVPCKVCGDKASGYHYGVTSCEGCKGFFRRSIQKQIEYRCLRDGKCMVYRLNRNRCQYCRFKKCLAVGMSRDSVRYGRVPKRSRERMQDDARVSSMTGDSEVDSELEKKQLALYDIILSVSQAHHSNCAYTDDKIKNLTQKPIHFPLDCLRNDGDPMLVNSTELLEQQKVIMWQTMAQYTMPEIQHVVEFAKRIPSFTDLMQDDQLVLIKAGFFEVWLVRISRMFSPQHMTVMFFDGCFVTRDQMEMIYNADLVSAMFAFSVSFNNLHLNDGEIGLFTAVVLLTPDRPGLSDPRMVEQQQEKLIEALKLQLSRSHSSDPQVFPNLLLKLSELRSVGAKHNEVLSWYRMNWRLLKLPPLYAEIYDIPKDEEQQQQQQQQAAVISAPQGNGLVNSHMANGNSHNGGHSSSMNGNGVQIIVPPPSSSFNGVPTSPYGADIKVSVALQHLQAPQMAATNGGP